MILKSLGRKSSNYDQLLHYILKTDENIPVPKHLILKQNIFGETVEEMSMEYLDNESNREYKRNGVNKMYHEILSLHANDTHRVNDEILRDIAREYMRLRNEHALIISAPHQDKDHVHWHFCVSGTELSGKSLRITKQAFNQIKKDLQNYQITKYPELQHSIVDLDKPSKSLLTDKEHQVVQRLGKSQKMLVKEQIEAIYEKSNSQSHFNELLIEAGFSPYIRGTKSGGVTLDDGRNIRFKSLGFDADRLQELDSKADKLQEIGKIRSKDNSKDQEILPESTNNEESSDQERNEVDKDRIEINTEVFGLIGSRKEKNKFDLDRNL